jgi:hypothetical protein
VREACGGWHAASIHREYWQQPHPSHVVAIVGRHAPSDAHAYLIPITKTLSDFEERIDGHPLLVEHFCRQVEASLARLYPAGTPLFSARVGARRREQTLHSDHREPFDWLLPLVALDDNQSCTRRMLGSTLQLHSQLYGRFLPKSRGGLIRFRFEHSLICILFSSATSRQFLILLLLPLFFQGRPKREEFIELDHAAAIFVQRSVKLVEFITRQRGPLEICHQHTELFWIYCIIPTEIVFVKDVTCVIHLEPALELEECDGRVVRLVCAVILEDAQHLLLSLCLLALADAEVKEDAIKLCSVNCCRIILIVLMKKLAYGQLAPPIHELNEVNRITATVRTKLLGSGRKLKTSKWDTQ